MNSDKKIWDDFRKGKNFLLCRRAAYLKRRAPEKAVKFLPPEFEILNP